MTTTNADFAQLPKAAYPHDLAGISKDGFMVEIERKSSVRVADSNSSI